MSIVQPYSPVWYLTAFATVAPATSTRRWLVCVAALPAQLALHPLPRSDASSTPSGATTVAFSTRTQTVQVL